MNNIEKIKQLRSSTGAGFKDCSSALQEASDDIENAIEILRVKGNLFCLLQSIMEIKHIAQKMIEMIFFR